MLSQMLQPEIKDLINSRNFTAIREVIEEWTPADIAEIIADLEPHEQGVLFRLLPKDLATDTFEHMSFDLQEHILKSLGNEEVAFILNEMAADDRTAFLEELPSSITKQLMLLLNPKERSIAQSLLGYPENSIGRIMTPDYLSVKEDLTVKEVLDYIRLHGKDSETINIIYIVNDEGKLIDDLRIREILLAPLDTQIKNLTDGNFVYLNVNDDQETAIEVFKKYDRVALPVTDKEGVLIGIVTVDDVLDVIEEEATEDIQKMGAVSALEEPYISISILDMIKKRGGWLSLLFIGEMLTAHAMGFFEEEISKAVILALFVPLIISSGGNSGSQATTLVIRALALGEVSIKDWWIIIKREVFSGLFLGSILGTIGFLKIMIWQLTVQSYGEHWLLIGLTIGFSLIGVVMWGTIIGSMFPLMLKRVGFDPATSSAPFVATMVDVTGIIIYFGFAIIFLSGTIL